jgi:hypothetical protein
MVTRPELIAQAEPMLLDAEPAAAEELHDTSVQSLLVVIIGKIRCCNQSRAAPAHATNGFGTEKEHVRQRQQPPGAGDSTDTGRRRKVRIDPDAQREVNRKGGGCGGGQQ